MFPDRLSIKDAAKIISNKQGFGLISAIFVIVILALFGLLVARFVATTSITSSEDYLWSQALYSAESAAQLRILYNDGGGSGVLVQPKIGQFSISENDNFPGPGSPAVLRIEATIAGLGISREVEVKYIL